MTEATTHIISKLEALLAIDAEAILTQSLQRFVAEQIVHTQQRLSQLYLENQRFLHKYGMPLEAFMEISSSANATR